MNLSLKSFPRDWRAKHGEEMSDIFDILVEGGHPAWKVSLSFLSGGISLRTRSLVRRHGKVKVAAALWLVIAIGLQLPAAFHYESPRVAAIWNMVHHRWSSQIICQANGATVIKVSYETTKVLHC